MPAIILPRKVTAQPGTRLRINESVFPGRSQVFLPSLGYNGLLYGKTRGSSVVTLQNANAPFTQVKSGGYAHVVRPNTSTLAGESYKWQTSDFDIGSNGSMFWYGYLDTIVGTGFEGVVEYGGASWGLLIECTGSQVKASYVDNPTSAAFTATLSAAVAVNVPIAIGLIKSGTKVTVVCRGNSASTSGGNGGIRRSAGSGFGYEANGWNYSGTFLAGVTSEALSVSQMQTVLDRPWSIFEAPSRIYFFPSAAGGAGTIYPDGLVTGEAFGSPTITAGNVTAYPDGLVTGAAFGSPTISALATMFPNGLVTGEAFGSPVVTAGVVTIYPNGLATGEAFGTLTIGGTASGQTAYPDGLASDAAFGAPIVLSGNVTIYPDGLASAAAMGNVAVGPANWYIVPNGLDSQEAFGSPTFNLMLQYVYPNGLTSSASFGTFTIAGGIPGATSVMGMGPIRLVSVALNGVKLENVTMH